MELQDEKSWTLVSDVKSVAGSETSSFVHLSAWDVDEDVVGTVTAAAAGWQQPQPQQQQQPCARRATESAGAGRQATPRDNLEEEEEEGKTMNGAEDLGSADERASFRRGWRRFEGRYEGMGGKSCGAVLNPPEENMTLHIKRGQASNATELELEWPVLQNKSQVVLDHAGLWMIEEELAARAVRTRRVERADLENETIEYVLPVVGHLIGLPQREPSRNDRLDRNAVHTVRDRGTFEFDAKRVGRYDMKPPSELTERFPDIKPLPAKLHVRGGPPLGRRNLGAHCRSMATRGSFQPRFATRASEWLEVDLGSPRVVQAVCTRARRIATTVFPTSEWLRDRGVRKYNGQRVMVINERGLTPDTETYFPEYELQYFRDADGAWVSCGVLKGPRNNFEQRVAWLTVVPGQNVPGGIFCQRMRVRVVMHKYDADYRFRGLSIAAFGPPARSAATKESDQDPTDLETVFVLSKPCKPRAVEVRKGWSQRTYGKSRKWQWEERAPKAKVKRDLMRHSEL